MSEELKAKLRALCEHQLLDEERLEDEEPWGEDGPMNAFERGQDFGRHELAEEILGLLDHA